MAWFRYILAHAHTHIHMHAPTHSQECTFMCVEKTTKNKKHLPRSSSFCLKPKAADQSSVLATGMESDISVGGKLSGMGKGKQSDLPCSHDNVHAHTYTHTSAVWLWGGQARINGQDVSSEWLLQADAYTNIQNTNQETHRHSHTHTPVSCVCGCVTGMMGLKAST